MKCGMQLLFCISNLFTLLTLLADTECTTMVVIHRLLADSYCTQTIDIDFILHVIS